MAGGEAEERRQSDHQWKRMRESQEDLANSHTGFDRSLLHERSEETNYSISMVLGRAAAGSAWIGKAQKEKNDRFWIHQPGWGFGHKYKRIVIRCLDPHEIQTVELSLGQEQPLRKCCQGQGLATLRSLSNGGPPGFRQSLDIPNKGASPDSGPGKGIPEGSARRCQKPKVYSQVGAKCYVCTGGS